MKTKESVWFGVDRECGRTLANQLAENLKSAIMHGVYRPGEVLPGILQIAAEAKVSANTVRHALRCLADEGWIEPRRHVGSVVSVRGLSTLACSRILFFTPWPYFCYWSDQFVSTLRGRLGCGTGRVSIVVANADRGKNAFAQLENFLGERWDLVMEVGMMLQSRRLIEASGWPFVAMTNGLPVVRSDAVNCIGAIDVRAGLGLPEMVRDCVNHNVKSVLQVQLLQPMFDITPMMDISDISVETISVPKVTRPGDAALGGLALMRRWLAVNGRRLPDLILFTDDWVAHGGLMALDEYGIRIPEDVFVASFAVKGHGPIWRKPLARLEMDPFAHARIAAKSVKAYLHGAVFPGDMLLGSVWNPGKTFWQ